MTDDLPRTPRDDDGEIPAKPYLLRALYQWCTDNGYTPHITVQVDDACRVPPGHVKGGQITLNIGMLATQNLQLGNDYVEFLARFNGTPQQVSVPVNAVINLYARETGAGMGFDASPAPASAKPAATAPKPKPAAEPPKPEPTRPVFRLID